MTSNVFVTDCSKAIAGGLLSACLLVAGPSYGQQYSPQPGQGPFTDGPGTGQAADKGSGAAGIRLEPFVIYPSVSLSEGYNDNVAYQAGNRLSSAVTVLSPAVLAELKGAQTAFRLGYIGTFGRYSNSTIDDFNYHEFRAGADFDFSARSNLRLIGDYLIKSDPRGATVATIGAASPNKYHQADIGGTYSYGAPGAQGRIEIQTLFTDKRYQNNRAITSTLDFDSQQYGGTFFWRVGPKTEWLINGVQTRTDYKDVTSVQDNVDNKVFTGLKWEATAATAGVAKIGYSERKYSNSGAAQSRARGGVWEIGVKWSPLTYSVVDVATGKRFADSQAGIGSTVLTAQYVTVLWTHGWTERIRSSLSGSYEEDSYAGISRTDKVGFVSAKMEYEMRRWLSFGAEYKYSDRDSSLSSANYRQNLFLLSVRATL